MKQWKKWKKSGSQCKMFIVTCYLEKDNGEYWNFLNITLLTSKEAGNKVALFINKDF